MEGLYLVSSKLRRSSIQLLCTSICSSCHDKNCSFRKTRNLAIAISLRSASHNSTSGSGVTPIGQGWTNARGPRGPNFLYILIFQVLGVSHLFYSQLVLFQIFCRRASATKSRLNADSLYNKMLFDQIYNNNNNNNQICIAP